MKKIIFILLLILVSNPSFATRQAPDVLYYNGTKQFLKTGWGHPSPLHTYFLQNKISYPFKAFSTGNYRGHVATWLIKDNRLYLTKIHIRKSVVKPEDFNIKSISKEENNSKNIHADWFSGIISSIDKTSTNPNEYKNYFFHIKNGIILATVDINNTEFKQLNKSNNSSESYLNPKSKLLKMNKNYISYYFRINEDERVSYKKRKYFLVSNSSKLSPILS